MQQRIGKKGDDHRSTIEEYRPHLKPYEEIYRDLHQNPELPFQEGRTASIAAEHLRSLHFDEVHTGIGKHGVVGVFKNGSGPVVMLRSELDALPVQEETGLPYASTKRSTDENGKSTFVMHACGHDMHVSCLLAVADLLRSAEGKWCGTLICIFQPAEESFAGAKAMIKDGLFNEIPMPDVLLGQHNVPQKAGGVAIRAGPILSACDRFSVRIFGKGGHGSAPHRSRDPLLTACRVIANLQTIISREVEPGSFAVLTCGSLHGGYAANVIPNHTDFELDVRTYDPVIREMVIAAMRRTIEYECRASGMPREPSIHTKADVPPLINNNDATERLRAAFEQYFGDDCSEMARDTASDDFSTLGDSQNIPYVYWNFGTIDPEKWDEAVRNGTVSEFPDNHNPHYAPAIEPTLKTGVDAFALAALTFLGKKTER